jgi:surfeit locus 1 family protein
LKIDGTEFMILVDRGWIPFEDWETRNLSAYDKPGSVQLDGMLRVSQTRLGLRDCLDETAGEPPFQIWCFALNGISSYLPYDLLPVYVIQAPTEQQTSPPYREIPIIEISEGSHLSYAIQWFSFSAILLIGYPFFVRREIQGRERKAQQEAAKQADEYQGWSEHINEDQ